MKIKQSPKEQVIQYYPDAKAVNIGSNKGGNYFNIMSGEKYIGQGKSKKAAWKAASRNI